MENAFCGNALGLIRCVTCWDGIGLGGTWHETDDVYLWVPVGMDLKLVAAVTVLLTETWYFVDLTAHLWTHSD